MKPELERLALEAGKAFVFADGSFAADRGFLERFAMLVAQAENERCRAVINLWGNTHEPWVTVNAQNMARKLERAIQNPGVRAAAIRSSAPRANGGEG